MGSQNFDHGRRRRRISLCLRISSSGRGHCFAPLFVVAADGLTPRQSFYTGLALGLLIFPLRLAFFWRLFGPASVLLWLILSFWTGLFLLMVRQGLMIRWVPLRIVLVPAIWTGIEYFRSELYPLKFSWANIGYAFAETETGASLSWLGVYGIGFVLMLMAVTILSVPVSNWRRGIALLTVIGLFIGINWRSRVEVRPSREIRVAGVQMEFPELQHALTQLTRLAQSFPETEIFVLSEYTFQGPVPVEILDWCRDTRKHLVLGAKDPQPDGSFFNTAFVVGPEGKVVFQQAKSVPIQFFDDGKPATEQKIWNSPWGKIGICICYDFSYRRVVDGLVKLGAEALIVPTMDVVEWGGAQHRLHARLGPTRAAELRVPVFRLCSSGISQIVDSEGRVKATAGYPGEDAVISGSLGIGSKPRLPVDHWLAPATVVVTALFAGTVFLPSLRRRLFLIGP